MLKRLFISLTLLLLLLTALSCPVLAAEPIYYAAGGEVGTEEELIAALGGEEVVHRKEGYLHLMQDVTFSAPLVITGGSYTLVGAGVTITSEITDTPWITLSGEGTSLTLGREEDLAANDNLIFDGQGTTRSAPIVSVGEGSAFSFYAGTRFYDLISEEDGAAIFNEGTTRFYGGTIENAKSLTAGGAIASTGELFLSGGSISSCSAEQGGAVYNDGVLELIGTEITECQATEGGAVYNDGKVSLQSSTISSCQATNGGAVANYGTLTLTGGQILSSSATAKGGGVYNQGKLTARGTYLNKNTAVLGGTLYNGGSVLAENGTFSEGSAAVGGNVYNDENGAFELSGTTITWGEADTAGGIYNEGQLTLRGGYVTLNEAETASGILNLGTLVFTEDAYVHKSNEIWLPITADGAHLLRVEGNLNSSIPGTLRPCVLTGDRYEPSYPVGEAIVITENTSSSAEVFAVAAEDKVYTLTADGVLREEIPADHTVLYLVLAVVAFALTVTGLVFAIRFFDRRKGRVAQ